MMPAGRRIAVDLDAKEAAAVDALCAAKGLSEAQLVRQALRFYQAYDRHLERGGAPLPSPLPPKLPLGEAGTAAGSER